MLTADPKIKIEALLTGAWDDNNTFDQTPKIHTGWYNTSWGGQPQVTITNPMYSVINGGTTGITAMGGTGTLVRLMQCDLKIGCWVTRESSSVNPKAMAWAMMREVKRIVEANMFTDSELEFLTWLNANDVVEDRIQPIAFRYDNSVRLVWKDAF